MPDLTTLDLSVGIVLLIVAAAVIGFSGTAIARVADVLADRTGMGEALIGAVFVGGITSLSGSVTSIVAAHGGHTGIAVGNAVGGIAAQTAFLAIADMFYRRANLEHAAASVENLTQGALLCGLLALPLLAFSGPDISVLGIDPMTPCLICAYAFGVHLIAKARTAPMWHPRSTAETREDVPDAIEARREGAARLWGLFLVHAAVLAVAGFVVAELAVAITLASGLSESLVGGLFTSVSTSMPELVVAVAAVRRGALMLAVGDILGGNCFDVLFLAFSDVAYRAGSIYHAFSRADLLLVALSIAMTSILLLGLLRRETHGVANIGFESFVVLVLYAAGVGLLFTG